MQHDTGGNPPPFLLILWVIAEGYGDCMKKDLTGKRFGRLTVVERACPEKKGNSRWICRCDCGGYNVVRSDHLSGGLVKSCGCLSVENRIKHNLHNTRLYGIWLSMKERCYNPKKSSYNLYGGRGIIVCDEWLHDFQAFYDWSMANGYRDDLTLDREDGNKNYCPENCRWATIFEQNNNTSRNRHLTYKGETHTVSEWSRITGISRSTLQHRLVHDWPIERMLTQKPKK